MANAAYNSQKDVVLQAQIAGLSLGFFNVKQYGAKGNGRVVNDGVAIGSSTTITSATAAFTSADVGKAICIAGSGNPGGVNTTNPLITTVATYVNATTITVALAANSAGGGSAKEIVIGTDDTAAIQAAINAAVTAGGGTLQLPPGRYIVSNGGTLYALLWHNNISMVGSGYGNSGSAIVQITKVIGAVFYQISGSGNDVSVNNCNFSNFEVDCHCTNGAYNVAWKAFYIRPMVNPVFNGLYVHDTLASGIGTDYITNGIYVNNIINHCGYAATGTISSGGGGIGIGTSMAAEGAIIANNNVTNCGHYGIFIEKQGATVAAQHFRIIGNRCDGSSQTNGTYLGNGSGIGDSGGDGTVIVGNTCTGNAKYGISIDNGTLGTPPGVRPVINDNVCNNNTAAGISLDYTSGSVVSTATANSRAMINGNSCIGNGTYGIQLLGNSTYATPNIVCTDNQLLTNTTGSLLASNLTTAWIADNNGYNPLGPLAFGGVGASPWTYTAGSTAEALYITAGTVTSIVKNSVNCGFITGTILLQPNEQVVITYTVAPTVVRDAR